VNSRDAGSLEQTTARKRVRGTIDNEVKVDGGRTMLDGEHVWNYRWRNNTREVAM
jgi:hypothetical protein